MKPYELCHECGEQLIGDMCPECPDDLDADVDHVDLMAFTPKISSEVPVPVANGTRTEQLMVIDTLEVLESFFWPVGPGYPSQLRIQQGMSYVITKLRKQGSKKRFATRSRSEPLEPRGP